MLLGVSYLLFGIGGLAFSQAALAAGGPNSVFVTAVEISQSGQSEHTESIAQKQCQAFRLKPAQVKQFFRKAKMVDARVHVHERYSPCFAKGTVTWTDGHNGTWQIHSGGTGVVNTDDGRSLVLQCTTCKWFDPFAGGYGLR
jgi:hypothetical protein